MFKRRRSPIDDFRCVPKSVCAIVFVFLAYAPGLFAQAVGSITGVVVDSTGAVVPGAKVTATRVETGVAQSAVTTGLGTYTLPRLDVGTYNVDCEATGFKTGTVSDITLDVSQTRSVDFTLVVSGVTQSVEVTNSKSSTTAVTLPTTPCSYRHVRSRPPTASPSRPTTPGPRF